ncbi:hypothetical protein BGZ98_006788, partial [Dissophora globulifera]
MAFDDATSNIALNAGLNELQTGILLPPALIGGTPANLPYSTTDMALNFLPGSVDDGLVQLTMKFLNPYTGSGYTLLHSVDPLDTTPEARG